MPAQNFSQVISLQLEKVRPKVPLLYEREAISLNLIEERGETNTVSGRLMRLALQLIPGGNFGAFNPDGGDMGRGSGTQYDVATVTPQYFRIAVEYTKLVEYTTDTKEKAVIDAVNRLVDDTIKQFASDLDKKFQTSGNGVIGTIASVAGQVLTMTTPPGSALVRRGETVQVYDATLTTNRGSFLVGPVDPISAAQTITADATTPLPAGTVATDVLVYSGLSGASPTGLFGIKYHQNNATTGTWLNLNRATYPFELRTPRVNAGGAALVPSFPRLAYNFVRKALGSSEGRDARNPKKLIAYTSVEQEHAWENLGVTTAQIIKEGGGGRASNLDMLFPGTLTMSGVKIISSINADQTRIDYLDLSHWGRAVSVPTGMFDIGGNTRFAVYGPSGGIAASVMFYMVSAFQVWTDNPRAGAYVDQLARPAGY